MRFSRSSSMGLRKPPERPAWTPGELPLAWQTRVDPESVLIHASIPGEPKAKERPRLSKARIDEDTGTLIQGNVFTPTSTRQAEENLGWVFKQARRLNYPVAAPVGVFLFFRTTSSRIDTDNAGKLVLDAGQNILWENDQWVTELHLHLLRSCTHASTEILAWLSSRRLPST